MEPTRNHLQSAERTMRPFGIVLLAINLVWDGVTRVGEHAILSWVADHLGTGMAEFEPLRWIIEHPILLLLCCSALYCLFIIAVARHSAQTGLEHQPANTAFNVKTTGSQSPATVVGSMGDIGPGASVIIGSAGPQQSRDRSKYPHVSFCRWGEIPKSHPEALPVLSPWGAGPGARSTHPPYGRMLQHGFFLANDGGPAQEILVCRFEVAPGVWAISRPLPRMAAGGQEEFVFVWVDNPWSGDKWDLLSAIARAADKELGIAVYRADYSIKVSVVYRDLDGFWFRGTADLTYIRSQGMLRFGTTSREELDKQRPPCT